MDMGKHLFLATAMALASGAAGACRFVPLVPAGFVNAGYAGDAGQASQHLPANAKGALFWMAGGPYYRLRNGSVPDTYFIDVAPVPLDPRRFLLVEQPGGRRLEVKIEPLPTSHAGARYLVARQPRLARCIRENLFSLDGCPTLEKNAPRLVANGAFQDVSAAVRHAYGLFRIAPAEGFVPGHTYRISFTAALPKDAPFAFPPAMTLDIDRSPVLSWPAHALRPRVSREPHDIYPDEGKAVYVSYLLARDLLPYRRSIYLATRVTPSPHGPPMPPCGIRNPWGEDHGDRPLRFADGACHRVQVEARFPELADDLAGADPVAVDCPAR